LIVIIIYSISVFYLGQVTFEEKSNLVLKENAMDILTVLEKNGKLENAASEGQVNELRVYMNRLPKSLCTDLQIFNETNLTNAELSVLRPSCKKNYTNSATINRSFVVQNGLNADFYVARLTTWYKVEE